MATKTIANAGGNWNTNGTWVEGTKPTASDDVVATATSGNLTIDAASVCRSIDLTGYVGTLTHNAFTLSIGTSTAGANNNALIFPASGWTYTLFNASTSAIAFVSTSATQQTINQGGKTFGNVTFNGANGSWVIAGAWASAAFTLVAGSFSNPSFSLSATTVGISGSTTRSLSMGTGTWTLTGNGTVWNAPTTTNLTFNAGTSTISLASAASQTFIGGGLTYSGITFAATGTKTIQGSNTFSDFARTLSAAAATLTFTDGTTQTVSNSLTLTGAAGQLLTLQGSSTAGWTLAVPATQSVSYVNISRCTATGNALLAGVGSVDGGNNVNVTFIPSNSVAPSTAPSSGTTATSYVCSSGTWANTPTTWLWETNKDSAGWVTASTSQNPTLTLSAAGTYATRLTATNAAGSSSPVAGTTLTVSAAASGTTAAVRGGALCGISAGI